ncbi:MAG TPA: sensor histidine kinase [Micromonosporaceae bacterium]|nr:sensor histidine kinase [Micromonosporaceae bacterium]
MTGEPRASGGSVAAGGQRAAGGSGRAAGGRPWLAEALRRRPLLADALLALVLYAVGMLLWLAGLRELWPQSLPAALVWSAAGMLTYTAAARLPARRAVLATLLMLAPPLAAGAAGAWPGVAAGYLVTFNALLAVVCFLVGRTVRNQRAYAAALRVRARTAEEHLRSRAEQAVAQERRRIARELHDVVAHHVSVMGVLATGARRVLRRDPDAADEALTTIEETGRTTLRELRRLLSVLRTEAEPAAELAPQPGLGTIAALVEQVREAGLPVTLRIEGDPRPLDPGVALTVYRIVQEALTNTLKHAGAAAAEVRLGVADGRLTLEVCDTGHGPPPDGEQVGHGLLGMRERVALYGGTLRTGPRPGGGFRVVATIPADQLDGAAAGG